MAPVSTEEWIIAAIRVLGSLLVLRWALAGGIIAVVVDFSDLFLKNLLDLGGVSDYQAFDKWLDQVYQACFLVAAWRKFPVVPKRVALGLFAFRLLGFGLFEATGARGVLLVFPNVFEFWFLAVAAVLRFRPSWRWSAKRTALLLAAVAIPKEFQEYALHHARWLDSFTAVDAVEAIWRWVVPGR